MCLCPELMKLGCPLKQATLQVPYARKYSEDLGFAVAAAL